MSRLVVLSGAGINMALSECGTLLGEVSSFAYRSLSENVYSLLDDNLRSIFVPDSFDMILGTLMTLDSYFERLKREVGRFLVREDDVSRLLGQSLVRDSILASLNIITEQLTIPKDELIGAVKHYDPVIEGIIARFEKVQYFTTNYDGLFDHILYGSSYGRSADLTDFWRTRRFDPTISRRVEIVHLHGDLRYRPNKVNRFQRKSTAWPMIVVGDHQMKLEQIASQESLRFFNSHFESSVLKRKDTSEGVLAVIGFGFRAEDKHVVGPLLEALENHTFREVYIYDTTAPAACSAVDCCWVDANQVSLRSFLSMLQS